MKTYGFPQYTAEWWAIRAGIPTASQADKILTPTGKLSAQSDAYLNQLLAERAGYGDEPMEPTEWMLRGIALEPEARAFFELDTGLKVEQVGFLTNDAGTAGCSPDGLVDFAATIGIDQPVRITQPQTPLTHDAYINLTAGFEIKCPKASTHIGYLRGGDLPAYHKPQVHFSMAVTGLRSWWFLSYFPGLDPLIVQAHYNDYTRAVEQALGFFLEDLDKAAEQLGLQLRRAA